MYWNTGTVTGFQLRVPIYQKLYSCHLPISPDLKIKFKLFNFVNFNEQYIRSNRYQSIFQSANRLVQYFTSMLKPSHHYFHQINYQYEWFDKEKETEEPKSSKSK